MRPIKYVRVKKVAKIVVCAFIDANYKSRASSSRGKRDF